MHFQSYEMVDRRSLNNVNNDLPSYYLSQLVHTVLVNLVSTKGQKLKNRLKLLKSRCTTVGRYSFSELVVRTLSVIPLKSQLDTCWSNLPPMFDS